MIRSPRQAIMPDGLLGIAAFTDWYGVHKQTRYCN